MRWFEREVEIRYADTDQMGIVHHAVYACYTELGRTDLCAKLGMPYAELENQGTFLMVAAMTSRFVHPARYGQCLLVRTAIQRLSRRLLEFSYEISVRETGQLVFTGTTTHVFTTGVGKPRSADDLLFQKLSHGT
ncbi:MAG: acyl-CoA thioesterase [Acidobacteria bacterium]|nr:acyl-CoA thioesterase [Acidobacteriota bacterium]